MNASPFALPLQLALLFLVGWVSRQQQAAIDHLREENRVLRELLAEGRLHFTDAQRRRLAERARPLGRAALAEVASLVTPDTLLRWYRRLVAAKYDGSAARAANPERPQITQQVVELVLRMAR